jgi:hypothetical protein
MRHIIAFLRFWYDFIIGDDWTIAASMVVSVLATFWLNHSNIAAWWLLPIAAILTLGFSLWRNTRQE